MPPERVDEYLNSAALAERGWTPAMVRAFLGAPDATRPNPRFRSAAPMRLYARDRIEAMEETDEFRTRQSAARRRAMRSRAVADQRRRETLRRISAASIDVPCLGWDDLVDRAVRHRNHRNAEHALQRGEDLDPAVVDEIDGVTLTRWLVNYLRHALSNYDRLFDGLYGETGRAEAAALLRRRVYDSIARTYPQLGAECARQLWERSQAQGPG